MMYVSRNIIKLLYLLIPFSVGCTDIIPEFKNLKSFLPTKDVQLQLSPSSILNLDFISAGPSSAQTITLNNNGSDDSETLLAPVLTGADKDQFEIISDNCTGTTVIAGASCTFDVQLNATFDNTYTATVSVTDSVATSNDVSLQGVVTGISALLAITPDPNSSMDVTGGSSPGATVTFTVTNNGSASSANLNAAVLGGSNLGNFEILTDNCNGNSLTISGTCTIDVRPIATANAAYSGTLTIDDGAVASNAAVISGTASGFVPVLAITPDPSTAMDVSGGSSPGSNVTFTVTNTGTFTSANLNAAVLAGANTGNFEITADTCSGNALAISGDCTIDVRPIATSNGAYSATLTIGDGAVTSNSAVISGTASGFTPVLAITPAPQTAMDVSGGSSPGSNVTFTVTNTGTYTSTNLNAAVLGGANTVNFEVTTDNCSGSVLAISGTCTVVVRPKATANGAYSATLTIGDGAVTSNSAAISGTASGFAPVLAITPDPKIAMDITGGSSPGSNVTFTVTNTGTFSTANLNAAVLGGTNVGNFEITTDNCSGNTLAISGTCTVDVRPKATANAGYSATLTIGDGAVTSNSAAISGAASGFAAALAITPDPESSMDVTGGSSPGTTVEFTVTNAGTSSTANLNAAALSGANASNFEIVTDNCSGNSLAISGTCTVYVRPTATSNMAYSANLSIGDGSVSSNAAVISGTASGFVPALAITPDPETGMDVTGGASPGSNVTFTVTNTGTYTTANLNAAVLAGANTGNFEITTDNCSGNALAISGTCTVDVRPKATANGAYSATLTIGDGAVTSNSAAISGTASGFAPALAITPGPKTGMDITSGSSPGSNVTFTITNTGTYTTASLNAAVLAGTNIGNFEITTDSCSGNALAISGTCTVDVRPKATANGAYSATLTIGDGAVTSNSAAISGTASGFIPALAITPDPKTGMDITSGLSPGATIVFTVTNTGTFTTANLNAATLGGVNPTNFEIVTDNCTGNALAISGTCTVDVRPIAVDDGVYSATLSIDDGTVSSNAAALSGTAAGFAPVFDITPDPRTAMNITGGSSPGSTVTFTVTNNGSLAGATMSVMSIGGANAGNFEIVVDNCDGEVLGISASCTVDVRPIATDNGAYSAALTIWDGTVISNAAVISGTASGFAVDLGITPDPETTMNITGGASPGTNVQFTVTNNGSLASANLNAASLGGTNPGNFEIVTDNCNGNSLAPSGTCTIDVRPKAIVNGAYTATLNIGDGAVTSNAAVLSGSAVGFVPDLTITPDPKTAMNITGGSSPGTTVIFTVENTGNIVSSALASASLGGTNPGNFEVATDNCFGAPLTPSATCTIEVHPKATDNGAYSATLSIGDGAVTSNLAALSGTAAGFAPIFAITPDPKTSMDITGGTSPGTTVTFTVTNNGNIASANFNAATLAGTNPGNFEIVTDNCSGNALAISGTCTVHVRPIATTNGAYTATLTIGDGAVSANVVAISGEASGFAPVLAITPEPKTGMDFTGVYRAPASGSTVTFTITNTGTSSTANLNAAVLGGNDPGNFTIVADNCNGNSLTISGTCTVDVAPTATTNGPYSATLSIGDGSVTSNAAVLSGTAAGIEPVLTISPDPITAMDITSGTSPGSIITLTVTNDGSLASLNLNAAALGGVNPTNFEIVTDNCTGNALAIGGTCTVDVRPIAVDNGTYSATLSIGDGSVTSNSAAISGTASGFAGGGLGLFDVIGVTNAGDTSKDNLLTDVGNGTLITVHWSPSANATGYDVNVMDDSSSNLECSPSGTVTGTSVQLSGCVTNGILGSAKTYRVEVTATDGSSYLSSSGVFTFTAPNLDPGNFHILGIRGASVDHIVDEFLSEGTPSVPNMTPEVHWTKSAGASGYNIVIKDSGSTTVCSDTQSDGNASSYLFTSCNLAHGEQHTVEVEAFNAGNNKPATNNEFVFDVAELILCSSTSTPPVTSKFIKFYDDGGDAGNLSVTNCDMTIDQSSSGASAIDFTLKQINVKTGSNLIVYDSVDNSGGNNRTYTDSSTPPDTFSAFSNYLHVTWSKSGGGTFLGWEADIVSKPTSVPTLANFSITEIKSTGDTSSTLNDSWIVDTAPANLIISYGEAHSSAMYDITVRDKDNKIDICKLPGTSLESHTFTFPGDCNLHSMTPYYLYVTAYIPGGIVKHAINNGKFIMILDREPFDIKGIKSGTEDQRLDHFITHHGSSVNVDVVFQADPNNTSGYEVKIYNDPIGASICSGSNASVQTGGAIILAATSCNIVVGETYYADVISNPGGTPFLAINNKFKFEQILFIDEGNSANDQYGFSVAGVNFDNVGGGDIVVGAPFGEGEKGYIKVIKSNNLSSPLTLVGGSQYDKFGYSVDTARDFDTGTAGDEIVVGAPGADSDSGNFVIYDSSATEKFSCKSDSSCNPVRAAGNKMGHSVAGVGEFDGAGGSDVLAGSPHYLSKGGFDYVDSLGFTRIAGFATGSLYGWSLAYLGVFKSGNGVDHVLVGAPGDSSSQGIVFPLYGGGTYDYTYSGEFTGDQFGYAVAGLGDLNSDGDTDFIASSPGYGGDLGKVYIINYDNVDTPNAFRSHTGESQGEEYGYSVSSVGNFDGGTKDDYAVGAPNFAGGRGKVYVYSGETGCLLYIKEGTMSGDKLGSSLSSVDFNSDSMTDLVIGIPGYSSNKGAVFVVPGKARSCL